MESKQIREAFKRYWTSPPRNNKFIENVSLVPNVDSTLLYVNSGMFPLAPYLGGQPHPLGTRLCNFQRCLRTNYDEMIEIGDNRHTLMFEMMGDWSLGDYFKKEQIPWIMGFWVKELGLDPSRLYVTVFAGDEDAPRDDDSIAIWKETFKEYGIDAEFSEDISNIPSDLETGKTHKSRIFPYPKKKNWWERAHSAGELGGPTSEMFYDLGKKEKDQDQYHINDDSGRFIEIGNNVFMEYKLSPELKWEKLPQRNVDFGGGFERIAMIAQGKTDIYETDIYQPILSEISKLSGKQYKEESGIQNEFTPAFRVIADHGRAATFIIADGVKPANKDQGYILRRFIRRMVRFGNKLGINTNFGSKVAEAVIDTMQDAYPHLAEARETIISTIEKEENTFRQSLSKGLKELEKYKQKGGLDGETAFYIYETYGFPVELTLDELQLSEDDANKLMDAFKEAEKKHRDASRLGAEKKFKGGLADQSTEVVKLHTTHHLLLRALQVVLGEQVKQRGSNITAERLRLDINYGEKLTDEQVAKVEQIVNEKIDAGLDVVRVEMPKDEAVKLGAEMEFGQKYPDIVSVYQIKEKDDSAFSKEFCGGPHVNNTAEIAADGKHFKIAKQENIGGGLRRIKGILTN